MTDDKAALGGVEEMRARKDAAYLERNKVVAALAKCFPSGRKRTNIEGWSDDWHGCVYIDLPTGQVSWHYHDSHAHLFADLPKYQGEWDGHDTDEKYRRLAALLPAQRGEGDDVGRVARAIMRAFADNGKTAAVMSLLPQDARAAARAAIAALRGEGDDVDNAVAIERERCARIAENFWIGFPDASNEAAQRASVEIPAIIRSGE